MGPVSKEYIPVDFYVGEADIRRRVSTRQHAESGTPRYYPVPGSPRSTACSFRYSASSTLSLAGKSCFTSAAIAVMCGAAWLVPLHRPPLIPEYAKSAPTMSGLILPSVVGPRLLKRLNHSIVVPWRRARREQARMRALRRISYAVSRRKVFQLPGL